MSFWSKVGNLFKQLGTTIAEALGQASIKGLTEEVVSVAKEWVKAAANKELDNNQKRDFVIAVLKKRFPLLPESIIRLAIELAVQAMKKEIEKI